MTHYLFVYILWLVNYIDMSRKSQNKLNRGYFGIGIYKPKTNTNIGTLWRSVFQLGAAYIFVIGQRSEYCYVR